MKEEFIHMGSTQIIHQFIILIDSISRKLRHSLGINWISKAVSLQKTNFIFYFQENLGY